MSLKGGSYFFFQKIDIFIPILPEEILQLRASSHEKALRPSWVAMSALENALHKTHAACREHPTSRHAI